MRKTNARLAGFFALALLALGAIAAPALAGSDETEAAGETLVGQLSWDSERGYVLAEEESGNEILVRGSDEMLADHVDQKVELTGKWAEDDEGNQYFSVSNVTAAA